MTVFLVSLAVYPQMFICGVLYCLCVIPVLAVFLPCSGFRKEKLAACLRFLILGFGKVMIRIAVRPYIRVEVGDISGEEPAKGAIFVLNHRSASDPFLVAAVPMAVPPAQAVNGWPMRLPFFGFFARHADYLDVTRMTYEETLARSKKLLERNVPLFVFPEGTRSGGRSMNQFHGTFFRIAKELGVPMIPVAVAGNERIPDRRFRMSPGRILVRRLPSLSAAHVAETSLFRLKEEVRTLLMNETAKMDGELHHDDR